MPDFRSRRIGRTDLAVTELGLGTGTLAGLFQAVPTAEALATITAALDAGVTFYDTSAQYGLGRAEHLLGDGLRTRRAGTVLSTKVGRLLKPYLGSATVRQGWVDPFPFVEAYDYSYDGIMRAHDDSLMRLGLARIDVLLVHDIGTFTHGADQHARYWAQLAGGGYRALAELKASGRVDAIGIGVNEWPVLMDAFGIGDWDVFLLAGRYTLLEQTALDPLLATCLRRGTSIICGGPFNSGALVGNGQWNYAAAPPEVVARVARLEALCREHGVALGAAALQFPLAHDAVCTVLPGPKSPAELAGILDWWHTQIPPEFWAALARSGLVAPGTPLPGGLTAA